MQGQVKTLISVVVGTLLGIGLVTLLKETPEQELQRLHKEQIALQQQQKKAKARKEKAQWQLQRINEGNCVEIASKLGYQHGYYGISCDWGMSERKLILQKLETIQMELENLKNPKRDTQKLDENPPSS